MTKRSDKACMFFAAVKNALNEDDLADFLKLQKTKADSENSWSVDVSSLGEDCDLSVKNPNKVEEKDGRSAAEIVGSLLGLHDEAQTLLDEIKMMVE